MNRIRAHARANAVAYLALFVALSGTSYAAAILTRDSVTDKQIAPRAVGASELKAGAVTSRKVRGLRLEDLKRGELNTLAADAGTEAQTATGAMGAPGPPGPEGAPGSPGAAGPPGSPALVGVGSVIYNSVERTVPPDLSPHPFSGRCANVPTAEPDVVVSGVANPGLEFDEAGNLLSHDWLDVILSQPFDLPDDADEVPDDGWGIYVLNRDPGKAHKVILRWTCAPADEVR